MSNILCPCPKLQFIDEDGVPIVGGSLWTYKAGTSTPLATYSDEGGTANTNPVILDAAGRASVWIDSSVPLKIVLKAADGTIVFTTDDINSSSTITGVTVATIAAMQALTVTSTTNMLVTVEGYTAANDGGQGMFFWNATDTTSADNGMVIAANSAPAIGRWNRIAYGYINPRWYGAVGDNSTNDTAAFQAAGAYADTAGWYLLVDTGIYVMTSDPSIDCVVKLLPGAKLKWSGYSLPLDYDITDRTQHFVVSSGATVLNPNSTVLYPEWFGALGDGSLTNNTPTTDDTDAFQAAVSSASVGDSVVVDSSKKYYIKSILWKAGVNLKGDKSFENDSTAVADKATIYKATLQYNDASGTMISCLGSGGNIQGFTIQDVILDGATTATTIINLACNQPVIKNCTVRRAASTGILLSTTVGATHPVIENNHVYDCDYGIYVLPGSTIKNAVIRNNIVESCTSVDIFVNNNVGYIVSGNIIKDVKGTGIVINNDIAETNSMFSGNTITAETNNDAVGILIASTVTDKVLVLSNSLIAVSTLTGTIGIKTTGSALVGDIMDNEVAGFQAYYYLSDQDTQVRYTSEGTLQLNVNEIISGCPAGITGIVDQMKWGIMTGTGAPGQTGAIGLLYLDRSASTPYKNLWSKYGADGVTGSADAWGAALITNPYLQVSDVASYNIQLGDRAQIQAADKAAQLVAYRTDALSTTPNSNMLLKVVGGHASETGVQYNNTTIPGFTGLVGATGVSNLWDRESILRYTGSNGIEGARIHKGIGLDDTCNDPAVTDFTWEQKDPLAGQHRFGNRDAVQAIIGPVGVAGCTGVLSVGGLQFGSSAVSISDVKTLICNTSLTYQTINKFVAMTISSANTANEIKPYWRAPTSNVPESLATTSTWTRALGLQTQVIPTGQTYQPGDYVLMATTTKVTWLTNWWTKYFLWGYVTAYNAGTGSMTMNVLVCGGGAGGTLVNSFVMAAFPWMPSCLVSSYYETVDGVQCGLYPTPVNMYWAENHGITLQSVSFMCDFLA